MSTSAQARMTILAQSEKTGTPFLLGIKRNEGSDIPEVARGI
jgi:hypothetical protein